MFFFLFFFTDAATTMSLDSNPIKRCSSVPNINSTEASTTSSSSMQSTTNCAAHNQGSCTSQPQSSPVVVRRPFTRLARRFSTNCSPLSSSPNSSKLVPRISQLKQEEGSDIVREVNHERETISDMQMSQSCEELNIITDGWSVKEDSSSNSITHPLHLNIGSMLCNSSSPSPTRHSLRFPYHNTMSPSPTRKTFTIRRSMSPVTMRPSQLAGSVKRKFEPDDTSCSSGYSSPMKKIFIDRNPSPSLCHSLSPLTCPSSDPEGRITPKLFVSKLITFNTTNPSCSLTSSPATEASNEDGSEMDTGSDSTSSSSQVVVDSLMGIEPARMLMDESKDI